MCREIRQEEDITKKRVSCSTNDSALIYTVGAHENKRQNRRIVTAEIVYRNCEKRIL